MSDGATVKNPVLRKAWERAAVVPGYDPHAYRKDAHGAWIRRSMYGRRDSLYGWEVADLPAATGEREPLPLQWLNKKNAENGLATPAVTAQKGSNVRLS